MIINKIKVENMESSRGNLVPNQFTITTDDGVYFQSYRSLIAFIPNYQYLQKNKIDSRIVFLDRNKWDYSVTTGKYRNSFLNETKKETEKKIKEGIYKLIDLNKE